MRELVRWSMALAASFTVSFALLVPMAEAAPQVPAPAPRRTSLDLSLPQVSNWQARREAAATRVGLHQSPATRAVERALDPEDYSCGPTNFDPFVDQQLSGLSDSELEFLLTSGVLDFPYYDALLFGTQADPEYALGNQGKQLTQTIRDLKRFWDIESTDVQMLAMHGQMLLDADRIARLLIVLYGLSEADAVDYAAAVSRVVATVPVFRGGAHSLFTLNAYAFSAEAESDPLFTSIPDKIVLGDGFLDFFSWAGLSDVGPRAILAHEFGHHIQFELGLFDSPLTGARATRRTELMADAFATYFAVHARGLSLNAKRVTDALQSFYDNGDCAVDDPGHHGTPQQRERTAAWAASLTSNARPQGRILSAGAFAALFDKQLPKLVAPDA